MMAATSMDELAYGLLAALGGGALGAVFFGGLWWTLRRSLTCGAPAPLLLASLLLRTGVTLPGLWLVGGGQGPRLLAALAGFIVARQLFVARGRAPRPRTAESADAPRT